MVNDIKSEKLSLTEWLLYTRRFTLPVLILIAPLSLILMSSFYMWGNWGSEVRSEEGEQSLRKEGSLGDCLKNLNLHSSWKHSTKRLSNGLERARKLENPLSSLLHLIGHVPGQLEVGTGFLEPSPLAAPSTSACPWILGLCRTQFGSQCVLWSSGHLLMIWKVHLFPRHFLEIKVWSFFQGKALVLG